MSADERIAGVQNVYRSFARGDVQAFIELVDADVVWIEPEGVEHAGTYRGRDTVLRDVLPKNTAWENHRVMPDDFVGREDTVVVLGHYAGKHKTTGKEMRAAFAHVWRFGSAGRVVKFDAVIDTGPIQRAMTS